MSLRGETPSIATPRCNDARAIAEMHCVAALVAYEAIFPPDVPKPTQGSLTTLWEQLLADPASDVGVAIGDGEIVGSVVVAHRSDVPSNLALQLLYVHPAWWGRGVGSRLHDWALDRGRARGAAVINLWVLAANARARGMYERRGWRHVSGSTLAEHDSRVVEVLYERSLA